MGSSSNLYRACRLALITALAALLVQPATAHPTARRKVAGAIDFEAAASHRPRLCQADTETGAGPAGWKPLPAQCVWQGRLVMRRWQAPAADAAGACTTREAAWLAWQRPRIGLDTGDAGAAWRKEWTTQALSGKSGNGAERLAIIEMQGGAALVATEWTWSPSPRAATRVWQRGRWDKLAASADKLRAPAAAPDALLDAWEKNLDGRPGDVAPGSWRWASEGRCLRMTALAPSQAPLPLPYAREDARLEQRTAMQIQLARRYPGATFLAPFRLLDVAPDARRAGAKYAAVWTEGKAVTGQLWIPRKDDAPALRVQVVAALPARHDTPTGLAARTGAARAIEHELARMAAIWSASHER
ncbi:MAG: hypothetical protein ACXW2U_00490 [Telluria sp.]